MLEVDSFWEYSDPAGSEARFRARLDDVSQPLTIDERLEILTQLARTYSLRGRFAEAHALLDQVEPQLAHLPPDLPRPAIRHWLERGRARNSTGEPARARGHFLQAWTIATASGQAGLAVDAAHMIAITDSGSAEAIAWARKGLALARQSSDAKAQALIPALLNNLAWEFYDQGEFAAALPVFEDAQQAWEERGKAEPIQIAKWSVACCLRALQRHQAALDLLQPLVPTLQPHVENNGYVFEEIGENLSALGQPDATKEYFQRAVDELAHQHSLTDFQKTRLAKLQARI